MANAQRMREHIYGKRRLREIDRRLLFSKTVDNGEAVDSASLKSDVIKFVVTLIDEDENEITVYNCVGVDG